jgi:two-component system OmpR family sensor kinase
MFRSLYAKLTAALLVLFGLVGIAFFSIARYSIDVYYQEITQELNGSIAMYIVNREPLMQDGEFDTEVLQRLFNQVMVINPSVEVYLLDPGGAIAHFSAPPEKIIRTHIDLEPVRRFLAGDQPLPIFGDDPRNATGQKIFSAFAVIDEDVLHGYLYAILGGEKYDSAAGFIQGNYNLKLSMWALAATVVFAFLAALVVFAVMTRRLRRLTRDVDQFRESNFTRASSFNRKITGTDEIDRLSMAFGEMSDRIIEQVDSLKKTDQLRRDLVSHVSHDLRTPLATMQGYIDTLLIKGDTLTTDEQRRYLEIASKHGEHLRGLVGDLFDLARLDSQNVRPHLEIFSLAELMQDIAQKYTLVAENQGIQLETELTRNRSFVLADISLIERVLENLIENALRYTPEGGTVRLCLNCDHGRVSVNVADTGVGIASDDLPHIFESFYRASSGRATEGSGLGLAIVKRILQLHGCSISAESQIDKGTSFTFDLPYAEAA